MQIPPLSPQPIRRLALRSSHPLSGEAIRWTSLFPFAGWPCQSRDTFFHPWSGKAIRGVSSFLQAVLVLPFSFSRRFGLILSRSVIRPNSCLNPGFLPFSDGRKTEATLFRCPESRFMIAADYFIAGRPGFLWIKIFAQTVLDRSNLCVKIMRYEIRYDYAGSTQSFQSASGA